MANADFTYTVGFMGDATNLSTTIQNFSAGLKSKPLVVPVAGGNLDVANSAQLAKIIDNSAQGLQKIQLTTKTFTKATGEQITVITKAVQTFSNGLGQTVEKTKQLASASKLAAQGWKQTGDAIKSTVDFGKMNTEYEKINRQLTGMAASAQQFLAKSKNMSGEQVKDAKATAQALIDEKKAYDAAYSSGQFEKAKQAEINIRKLNDQFKVQEAATKRAATGLQGWANTMATAVKQTVAYTTTLGAMRMAQQLLNNAIQFNIDLNKEMVNIQVLQAKGAQTPEEIQALAGSFNDLAKQMGVTTVEVAKGSVEWLRQGRTIEETTQLLKASTMLSKLGALESAEATELLTSTVNSYKIAVEDTTSVVDKMVAVDNNSATSTREIATALRYTAATAAEAGVSLDKLISYIATMSSVTRINAESIGQSMKTILTRMQDIKAGKIDEDGLGLNNVESALTRIGIKLRDTPTSFRDLGAVLEDVAAKWSTLNDIEQANIAKAIAGVRQANLFKVLMANMGDALKYQGIQADAAGTAMNRYQIYLQGVEAAQNKFRASLEKLYMGAMESGAITAIINLGTALLEFIDTLGGVKSAVILLAAAFALLKWNDIAAGITWVQAAIELLGIKAEGAAAKLGVLNLAALPEIAAIAAAVALLAGVAIAYDQIANAEEHASERHQKLMQELQTETDASKQTVSLTLELKELNKINDKSAEQLERYYEVQKDLLKLYPDLLVYYDDEGNAIIKNTDDLDKLIAKKKEDIDVTNKQIAQNARAALSNIITPFNTNAKKQGDNPLAAGFEAGYVEGSGDKLTDAQIDALNKASPKITQQFYNMGKESAAAYIDSLENSPLKEYLRNLLISAFADVDKKDIEQALADKTQAVIAELRKKGVAKTTIKLDVHEFNAALQAAKANIDKVAKAKDKLSKGEILTQDEAKDLRSMGFALEEVAGGYIITDKAMSDYIKSQQSEIENLGILTPEMQTLTNALTGQSDALNMTFGAYQDNINTLTSAQEELSSTGDLSVSTMEKLTEAGYGAAIMLDNQTGKFYLDGEAAKAAALAQLGEAAANARGEAVRLASLPGMASQAQKFWDIAFAADAAAAAIAKMNGQQFLSSLSSRGGGGGGGSTGTDPEIAAQEEKIKNLEKKKKKLEDALKAYKKWIDAQKESLKLMKEERDFNDEISEKNKALSKLKTEIYILSLDQSRASQAKRLKLEEEAAKLSTDITKKEEDRKYQLQVDALDKMEKKFEEMIEKQIAGIDKVISAIRDLIKALQEALSLRNQVSAPRQNTLVGTEKKVFGTTNADINMTQAPTGHTGGLGYELHHDGDFAGNLKSNEVYAKLLKGEYVATEGQMNNFMKNILPKMSNITAKSMIQNTGGDTNNTTLQLTVQGNLDKITLKDVENKVFSAMNKAIQQKGKQKNVFTNSI
jgi:TP901 family phage tail tape measure protein